MTSLVRIQDSDDACIVSTSAASLYSVHGPIKSYESSMTRRANNNEVRSSSAVESLETRIGIDNWHS